MNVIPLISLPIVSALIGWATNKLAIYMLFHPRKQKSFCGIKWQGLIPRRQNDIAEKTATIIEREFLSQHIIRQKVEAIDLRPHIETLARKLVHDRLGEKLRKIPLLGNFITERNLNQLEEMAVEEFSRGAKPMVAHLADDLERRLQVKELIKDRISALDLDQLERVVNEVAAKEFRGIELLGGLVGFLIGLVQVIILLLL